MKTTIHLELRAEGGVTVAVLREARLVYAGLDSFVEQVSGSLEAPRPLLALDLSAVNYIDSAAIGCLMDLYRRASGNGGALAIAGLQERVERMLRMTGAHEFIALHESAAAAVEALGGAAEESS